jgi:hypothetical protein
MSTGNLSGDTDHNTPLFILDGIAGIGKSTVAMTVAHRAASTNCLGASFFFSRDQEDRKHSYGFMRTIAYQLACYDAAYRNAIAAAVFSNPDALDKVLTLQFDLLVAKPLCSLLKQRTCPLVLVFDALDECVEPDASAVLNLILSSVSQLPNIRVFLTTRPELKLRKKYLGASGAHLFHFQSEDLPLEEDISLYVNHSLSLCKVQEALGDFYSSDWQLTEEEKAKLAKLSGKLFIFASTAIQFILDQQYSDPRHQLGKLLQPGGVSLLSGLYHYILNSAKPAHDIEDWLCRFQEIVGTILILQTPLSSLTLARLLSQKEDAVNATLTNLHSILAPESKKSALIYKVHHRSFYDFVTSHSCPSEFQILEKEQHLHLAKCCLQIMNNQLTWNICQVPTCSKDLEHRDLDVTAYISGELQYATCYWAYHLGKLVKVDPDLLGLFETFSKEHLLHWIEVLAYINQLKTAHNTIKETLDFLVCQNLIIIDQYILKDIMPT